MKAFVFTLVASSFVWFAPSALAATEGAGIRVIPSSMIQFQQQQVTQPLMIAERRHRDRRHREYRHDRRDRHHYRHRRHNTLELFFGSGHRGGHYRHHRYNRLHGSYCRVFHRDHRHIGRVNSRGYCTVKHGKRFLNFRHFRLL